MALTPLVRLLALRLGIVDHPERRKMHEVPVPLLGGASIVVSFVLVSAALFAWDPEILGSGADRLHALLAAAAAISLLGAYDDRRGSTPG